MQAGLVEGKSDESFIIANDDFIPLEKHLCWLHASDCSPLNACRLHYVHSTWPLFLHCKLTSEMWHGTFRVVTGLFTNLFIVVMLSKACAIFTWIPRGLISLAPCLGWPMVRLRSKVCFCLWYQTFSTLFSALMKSVVSGFLNLVWLLVFVFVFSFSCFVFPILFYKGLPSALEGVE